MGGTNRFLAVGTIAALLAGTALETAKITLYPVSATFRCPGANCVSADAIQGDGLGAYFGSASTQDGAYFNGGFDFYFPLPQSPTAPNVLRVVHFDLSRVVSCSQTSPCTFNTSTFDTYLSYPALVNPVDGTNTELASGFYSIPAPTASGPSSAPARVKFDFPDPDDPANYRCTLRWIGSSGSSLVTVTRTASNTWVIDAGGGTDPVTKLPTSYALLQKTNVSGHQVAQNIGIYDMSFELTVQCGPTGSATACPK